VLRRLPQGYQPSGGFAAISQQSWHAGVIVSFTPILSQDAKEPTSMFRPFRFDAEKTIQAVAFLLRREQFRCMNYMRLLKLLYIAEREILAESGKPLTGSPVAAMPRGPVLQDLYDLIRNRHTATPQWAKFFQVSHYHLVMTDDPGVGRISKFIASKLEEVAVRHQDDDEWDMVRFTHTLPEWKANDPGESSKPIPLQDILAAMGRMQDFEKIVGDARHDERARYFSQSDEPADHCYPF